MNKRLLALIAGLVVLLLLSAVLYQVGMDRLEGEPRSFWDSLGWAAETITTTGFGEDGRWNHPAMVLFVVVLQFIGVFLIFLIFPIYLIPFLEERFEERLPRSVPEDLRDHVVVFRYGPAVESLMEQLVAGGVPAVVVELDEAMARLVLEKGISVVYATGEDEGLEGARIGKARALVANGIDEENAAVTLGARQLGFTGEIIALVEEPMHRKPMALAGASAVYTPRHILAAALAARASDLISPRISGIQSLGRLQVRELRISETSRLAGKTLSEARIGAQSGATVIGQWVGGELVAPPTAEMVLSPRGILVVVGSEGSLDRLGELCEGATEFRRHGQFVIAGFGEVGRKVHQLLTDAGEETFVVDYQSMPGVDLVGNVLDPDVLRQVPMEDAKGIVIALDSDDLTLLSTVIARDLAPGAPVVARVNKAQNVDKIHRAGADFALSISQVSGQMLGRRLLGQETVSVDPRLTLLKVSPDGLVGRHPSDLRIRERTECSVVAVERGDEVIVEFDDDFRFDEGDVVYVCGGEEAIRAYLKEFPQAA